MKQKNWMLKGRVSDVAPHAGAWIETSLGKDAVYLDTVAPHAGAWIETTVAREFVIALPVAPHAGAWIETFSARVNSCG